MRVAAMGAMALTLTFFFSPSILRVFMRPMTPSFAAP